MKNKLRKYKTLAVVFFIIGITFTTIKYNELSSDVIWLYDIGSTLKLEVKEIYNGTKHTIVDEIAREYKLDLSREIYIKLDSKIATLEPRAIALGIVNFKMPYNLSVSVDNKNFNRIKRYILPIFFPKNFDSVEKELQALENVSFRYKHYLIADIIDWYLEFSLADARVYLYICIKKDGWLDGYNITVTKDGNKESLFLVWGGKKNFIFVQEVSSKTTLRIIGTIPFLAAAVFFGLYIKNRRLQSIDLYEALEKALTRIEKYSDTYYRLWLSLSLIGLALGIFVAHGLITLDSEITVLTLMVFFLVSTAILLVFLMWMCVLPKLDEIGSLNFLSPITPTVISSVSFILGVLIATTFNDDPLFWSLPLFILLGLTLILIRISEPRKELKIFKKEVTKALEEKQQINTT